jgi:hypothetical protein
VSGNKWSTNFSQPAFGTDDVVGGRPPHHGLYFLALFAGGVDAVESEFGIGKRLRFVNGLIDGESMSDLRREFGISRKTGYKIYITAAGLASAPRRRSPRAARAAAAMPRFGVRLRHRARRTVHARCRQPAHQAHRRARRAIENCPAMPPLVREASLFHCSYRLLII